MNLKKNYTRYNRQVILNEFGENGQEKLFNAKVLVIGAGGLGCPVLQYLAAAGVGTIGIVDFDVVELTNLQRQILFTVDDIGNPKAEIAAKKLKALNPEINLQIFKLKISNINALDIIKDFDVVIDGSDNFSTRYMINDACVLLNKPLVYGAVLKFEGQVAVFNLTDSVTQLKLNYRDLFSEAPEFSTSCNEVGVLGIVPGIIGTMQATEAIKIITGIGQPLCNKLLIYNALKSAFYDIQINSANNSIADYPTTKEAFLQYNYELNCNIFSGSSEISVEEFEDARLDSDTLVIDVRETGELPLITEFEHLQIPLSKLNEEIKNIEAKNKILVFCKSGQRSLQAASILKNYFPSADVFSLSGGIMEWKKKIESMHK